MKRIEAIIRPHKLPELRAALIEFGVNGLSVTEMLGCGRSQGYTEIYRNVERTNDYLPRAKVEIFIEDDLVENCVQVIMKSCRTGKIGDGKLFVIDIEQAVRLRTGETGIDAL